MNFKSTIRTKLLIVGFILTFVGLGMFSGCYSSTYYSQQQPRYADDGYADYDAPYYANQQPDWYDDNYYYFNGANGFRRVPRQRITYNIQINRISRLDDTRRNEVYNNVSRNPNPVAPSTNPVTQQPNGQQNPKQNTVVPRPGATTQPRQNTTNYPGTTVVPRPQSPSQVRQQSPPTVYQKPPSAKLPSVPMSKPQGTVVKRP